MIEQVVNIGSLQQGFINVNTGSNVTSTAYMRTGSQISGNETFCRIKLDCKSITRDDVDGSFEGDGQRIKDCPTVMDATRTDNPNDTCEYYWWTLTRPYDDGVYIWKGYVVNLYGTPGGNHETMVPYVLWRGDRTWSSSSSWYAQKRYETATFDSGGSITYYNSGTSGNTTTVPLAKLIKSDYNPETDEFTLEYKGTRGSVIAYCPTAVLGYHDGTYLWHYDDESGAEELYWAEGNKIINLAYHSPLNKFKFIFKIVDKHGVQVTPTKAEYLVTPKFTLQANEWVLDDDDILVNADQPDEIDTDIFVEPYPSSFWKMNDNDTVELGLIPDILPLGAFARCEDVKTVMLPESLTSIGREAFAESGLTKIKIPNNQCTYYATSFPPGCVVTGGHLIE